jgi:hypothetical protein
MLEESSSTHDFCYILGSKSCQFEAYGNYEGVQKTKASSALAIFEPSTYTNAA